MYPPNIDYAKLNQAIEIAKQMLKPYEESLAHLNKEIKRLQQEIVAATAIVELVERADSRRDVLCDCYPVSESYANIIGNGDSLDQHRQFLNMLKSRQKSYNKLLLATKKAIDILQKDIADLERVAKTPFRSHWTYFSVPGPGWSFYIFRHTPRQLGLQPISL